MKKFFLVILLLMLLGVLGFFGLNLVKEQVRSDLARPIPYPTITPKPPTPTNDTSNTKETKSIFVPYWALSEQLIDSSYDQVIYFGITPGKAGIERQEPGAEQIQRFVATVPPNTSMLLGVRMTESDSNLTILADKNRQKKIIEDSIAIAKQHNFSGIVLDLELAAIPFDSLKNQINTFNSSFYKAAKKEKLNYSITLYGDTFYRLRPFDVKILSQNADNILLMAYDFHKARGNPGPNFPLHGKENYAYDMTQMVDDFLKFVPSRKITVTFGMFGYDWIVDGQDNALSPGKSISYHELSQQFLTSCQFKNCSVDRDSTSGEIEIHYTDNTGKKHIIWSEDMESVAAKKAYLKQRGISSFSFWAYSYF
jgi:spore germination protein YaaH